MIYSKITELIGNTPLVELTNLEKEENLDARVIAKVEFFNPAGSIKDRIALEMIEEAEKQGLIKREQPSLNLQVEIRVLDLPVSQQQKAIKQF